MKIKILALVAVMMMAVSVSYAAPITSLDEGQTNLGYMHYNMSHSIDSDSFYLENGISDRFILGIENSDYSWDDTSFHATDIYGQYKLDPNVRLILGVRNYGGDYTNDNQGSSKIFYGVGAHTNLAPKLDGYASVTGSSVATEWQAGLAYNLNSQWAVQFGYKAYNEKNMQNIDGLGIGVKYKF